LLFAFSPFSFLLDPMATPCARLSLSTAFTPVNEAFRGVGGIFSEFWAPFSLLTLLRSAVHQVRSSSRLAFD